jgi:hypothetical protein
MFELLDRHFEGVTHGGFRRDLANKQLALLILGTDGAIEGFSTIGLWDIEEDGGCYRVLVSGDTIVDPAAWQRSSFPRAWLRALSEIMAESTHPLLWLLLTSGFRTYRLLDALAVEYYPRAGVSTPPRARRLTDRLARERFGAEYHASEGVVRFTQPQVLRDRLAGVPGTRLNDEVVRGFVALNPGHADGDELVCLASLQPDNLKPHARRLLARRSR